MRTLALWMAVAALLSSGCSRGDRSPVGRVTGTVNYRGQPIQEGTIIFEVPGSRSATGTITGGKITDVTTYDPGDGVPVGTAKIAVFATDAGAAASAVTSGADPGGGGPLGADYMGGGAKSLIPAKYNNPATSGLAREIAAGDNELTLDLAD